MFSARTESGYLIENPPLFNGYEIMKYEGNGCTSVVYKIRKKSTNEILIAKIISKTDMVRKKWMDDINNEITIHNMLNHPNIVRIYDTFEMTNHKKEVLIFIIEEYCSKGSLLTYINKFGLQSKYIRRKFETGLIQAVRYLHGMGYAHCDINAKNILIDKNSNVKLNDLGCSLFCPSENSIFFKNDIWSIGSILYILSEGTPLVKPIYINGCLHIRMEDGKLKALIEKCTFLNVDKRPLIENIMNDEHFASNDEDTEEKEVKKLENFEFENKDFISNSIFNNCYFEFSIDFGNQNDLKQSKHCKKNVRRIKKKNGTRKPLAKSKSKSQYFLEKQDE